MKPHFCCLGSLGSRTSAGSEAALLLGSKAALQLAGLGSRTAAGLGSRTSAGSEAALLLGSEAALQLAGLGSRTRHEIQGNRWTPKGVHIRGYRHNSRGRSMGCSSTSRAAIIIL
jgi:hypothetical protein